MENEKSNPKGLQWLDNDALTRIVEADLENQSELKSSEAKIAFEVLAARTPGLKL